MRAWLRDRRRGPFTSNNPVRRNLMALNRAIQGADSDRRNEECATRKRLARQSNRLVGCTARGTVSKPRIGRVDVIQFRQKEPRYRVAISSAVNGRCSTSLVLEKVRPDDASWPKSAPNGDALRVRLFLANHARLLPNAAILPINEAVEVKTRFVA